MTYLNIFSRTTTPATPQALPVAGTAANSAGGYSFPVDDWARLERFLILGSEGGSYYAGERELTHDNAQAVLRAIAADGARAVSRIVAVSESGRAPKNDPALFALALAASASDLATRRAALGALPRVARTGTHLFQFAGFIEGSRGWGRALRRAIATWYTAQPVESWLISWSSIGSVAAGRIATCCASRIRRRQSRHVPRCSIGYAAALTAPHCRRWSARRTSLREQRRVIWPRP